MQVEFEAVCGPKFMTFWDDCLYRVPFRRHRPLKLPLSCEVIPKRWFLGPQFVEGKDTPDFGQAFSNRSYFRACGRFWLGSVQRPRRLGDEKKKEEDRRRRICGKT